MHPALEQTDHRSAPMPTGPWIMAQRWRDLLFAHWALAPEKIRPLIPAELELDLWQDTAYVAVTPFWMSGVRPRGLPPLPRVSSFAEMNVRTYVKYKGIPGVYFFSLDAGSRTAVWAARASYHLPYYFGAISIRCEEEKFAYSSMRLEGPRPAEFHARFWPTSPALQQGKGGLEYFLTERYCLYTIFRERVLRAYIHHIPWPLQNADAEIERNSVALADGIELPAQKPLLHYSRDLEVLVWWPELA